MKEVKSAITILDHLLIVNLTRNEL